MDKPDIIEDLYGVYLLYSLNEKYLGRTYIGYTVNPKRRINQHNKGYFAGGAKRTNKKGPWKMVLIIHGFPNNIAALRFEWAWQNPERSRRLHHVTNKKRIPRKESHIQYRIRILSEMLRVGPWKRLPLTIRWLETEFHQDFSVGKFPPIHMPILYGPVLSKKISSSQQKLSPSKVSDCSETKLESNFTCHICKMRIQNNKLKCINSYCDFTSHINCLAKIFLEKDEYIPIEGHCPSCNRKILWGDLIRKLKGCHIQNGISDNFEDSDDKESSGLSDSEASDENSDKSMN